MLIVCDDVQFRLDAEKRALALYGVPESMPPVTAGQHLDLRDLVLAEQLELVPDVEARRPSELISALFGVSNWPLEMPAEVLLLMVPSVFDNT